MKWYKDRDFPEVKMSNDDILAVIENPKQLERVINMQNELVDLFYKTKEDLEISEQNVKDFEILAREWRKGYFDLNKKNNIKITELEQTADELKSEIVNLKQNIEDLKDAL